MVQFCLHYISRIQDPVRRYTFFQEASSWCADLGSRGPRTKRHHGQNVAARDLAGRVEEQDRKYKLERGLKTSHKGVRLHSDEQAPRVEKISTMIRSIETGKA